MIVVLLIYGTMCLLGYSDGRKMHAVFKLSHFLLGSILKLYALTSYCSGEIGSG